MTVGINVGNITDEIGSSDFLHSFFSTICVNCESSVWGSRFPVLMKELYGGKLPAEKASSGISELLLVKDELSKLSPGSVIWDIEDLKKTPPWGTKISNEITSLSNYFVTSTGRDLIAVLLEALEEASMRKRDATIVSY